MYLENPVFMRCYIEPNISGMSIILEGIVELLECGESR